MRTFRIATRTHPYRLVDRLRMREGFAVLTKGPVAIVPVATPLFALPVKRHGVRWRSAVAGVTH